MKVIINTEYDIRFVPSNDSGSYYVKGNTLFHSPGAIEAMYSDEGDCQVEDLTELTIYQYNELAFALSKFHPDYTLRALTGRFI